MRRLKLFRIERLSDDLRLALEDWAGILFAIGVGLLLFVTLKAQLAHAAEFPEVGAGTLLFQTADGGFDPEAPLATDVRISVAGVVARVAIAQRFRNTGTSWAEAVYALPLPDDAAVDTLKMTIGERVIEGEIHERAQAEKIYGDARAAGQHTSLVRQTSATSSRRPSRTSAPASRSTSRSNTSKPPATTRGEFTPAPAPDAHAALRRRRHAGGASVIRVDRAPRTRADAGAPRRRE